MKPRTNYMPPDEFKKLEDHILKQQFRGFKPWDIVMLFRLCYECGLRINEALKLDVNDFDFDTKLIDLGTTKTHENDSATIPPKFAKSLRLYIDTKRGRVWSLTRQAVYQWLKKWSVCLFRTDINFYDNRGYYSLYWQFHKSLYSNLYINCWSGFDNCRFFHVI